MRFFVIKTQGIKTVKINGLLFQRRFSMQSYLDLLDRILTTGVKKADRTGTGTIGISGAQLRFNLQEGFPLLTTKKVFWKGVITELLWFLKGDTHIKFLIDNKCKIWNANAYDYYKKRCHTFKDDIEHPVDYEEFVERAKTGDSRFGELGPVYGSQWRNFNGDGVDQIANAVQKLKTDPYDRRIIVSAWNPSKLPEMALPPCHMMYQFIVREVDEKKILDLIMMQRSTDTFLGLSFNICSYAVLLMLFSKVVGMEPGEFIWTGGDVHLYLDHIEQAKLQLSREPRPLPRMEIDYHGQAIDEFKLEDFKLIDYNPHPIIKAKMSV